MRPYLRERPLSCPMADLSPAAGGLALRSCLHAGEPYRFPSGSARERARHDPNRLPSAVSGPRLSTPGIGVDRATRVRGLVAQRSGGVRGGDLWRLAPGCGDHGHRYAKLPRLARKVPLKPAGDAAWKGRDDDLRIPAGSHRSLERRPRFGPLFGHRLNRGSGRFLQQRYREL